MAIPAQSLPLMSRLFLQVAMTPGLTPAPRLQRGGAHTPSGPPQREWRCPGAGAPLTRVGVRLLALAAGVWLNHQLGRPTRSLVAFVA
jgi:hypothetical protein